MVWNKKISCPNIKEDSSYELTDNRHSITFITKLDRDRIYEDLFKKLGVWIMKLTSNEALKLLKKKAMKHQMNDR